MVYRLFAAALAAGVLAGVVAFGLQRVKLIPLIERAEVYESAAARGAGMPPAAVRDSAAGAGTHDHAAHDHAGPEGSAAAPAAGGHDHAGAWEPEGAARAGMTLLADILAGTGFALLLTGAMALAEGRGYRVDLARGLLWGAAGFAVFTVAPALGLPPELPGMEGADLALRQAWWFGTVLATAAGLALLVFRREALARAAGALLVVLPHAIGAPHPGEAAGIVPAELAARFVTASMVTAALFWLVIGGASGWLFARLGREGGSDVAAV